MSERDIFDNESLENIIYESEIQRKDRRGYGQSLDPRRAILDAWKQTYD
jgi:hypothetical protein